MALLHHLKCPKPLYYLAANKFVLIATTMTLGIPILLLQDAHKFAHVDELLSQLRVLRPIHLLTSAILLSATVTIYLIHRPRTVYLVDYTCFQPSSNFRTPKACFLEHAHLSPFLRKSTVSFIARMLERSSLGEETCPPPAFKYVEPDCCLDEARTEAELVVFSAIDDLLAKTCISHDAIDVLITNCGIFCPVPSIADGIVNRYKFRGDIRVINLSGMGCSAGVTAVGLARNILQVIPWGSHALVVSTETLGSNHYVGNNRSMQLFNILFRMGGTAKLLSSSRSKARFRLAHVVRTTTAADDSAYKCVYQEEDDEGNQGVTLSKNLMAIAGDALKAHITAIGPLVLPASELLRFLLFSIVRKALHGRKRPYIPDFRMVFEHFCIHVGGPAVISSIQHSLNLSDEQVEPSRMTLHRFGNQSSASVWYEFAYIEAKGRMRKGDRVWMIGFGAGYKCSTAVWVCIKPTPGVDGPWSSCIHHYPVDVSTNG
ncbi:3-ketoacyl-CoA synthase 6 [Brachypodium distachyon]|uniref:3-ketoacyl-CoA synthase n=1 Tax=Brachypodium distachyon TaxID=15368 RepID=I1IH76_BRADI|nr:3-ketoacyl-CoA synthase 6 [Brachypodium distachyon]KQJ86178.1 hypothetical protein BRADI_4g03757v3 [Brachypodium distachyon]|eukprot:XP_003579261.1 3-ketoacyl-CoA synthase 6 [Brachypodium distachyon]